MAALSFVLKSQRIIVIANALTSLLICCSTASEVSIRSCIIEMCIGLYYYSRRHRRQSQEYSDEPRLWVCMILSVCLSVCPHDKIKTVENKIAKLGTRIVHHHTSLKNEY